MNKYEFSTFELGGVTHPGIKLRIINDFIHANKGQSEQFDFLNMLEEIKNEILKATDESDLEITDDDERQNIINELARENAMTLIATGKVDPHNMIKISKMNVDDQTEVFTKSVLLSREIDQLVKDIEKTMNPNTPKAVSGKFIK